MPQGIASSPTLLLDAHDRRPGGGASAPSHNAVDGDVAAADRVGDRLAGAIRETGAAVACGRELHAHAVDGGSHRISSSENPSSIKSLVTVAPAPGPCGGMSELSVVVLPPPRPSASARMAPSPIAPSASNIAPLRVMATGSRRHQRGPHLDTDGNRAQCRSHRQPRQGVDRRHQAGQEAGRAPRASRVCQVRAELCPHQGRSTRCGGQSTTSPLISRRAVRPKRSSRPGRTVASRSVSELAATDPEPRIRARFERDRSWRRRCRGSAGASRR
jgi:hypothetical protein